MKIKYCKSKDEIEEFDIEADSLPEILSVLRLHKGEEFVNSFINNKHYYFLSKTLSPNPDDFILLREEVIFTSYEGFEYLIIIPDISGEIPVAILVPIIAAAGAGTAAATAFVATYGAILALIGNMLFSVALSFAMQALSPTPEFGTSPASAKNKSNLFKGAPMSADQGGPIPLAFGKKIFCGGVLISSAIASERVKA